MNTLPVPPGISPPGGIFFGKRQEFTNPITARHPLRPLWAGLVSILSLIALSGIQAQVESPASVDSKPVASWSWTPQYHLTLQSGLENGGLASSRRARNRSRLSHQPGAAVQYHDTSGNDWTGMATWHLEHDYQYFNASEKRQYTSQRLAQLWLDWHYGPSANTDAVIDRKDVRLIDSLPAEASTWQARLGRSDWAVDDKGLLFSGQAPMALLAWQGSVLNGARLSIKSIFSSMERQDRIQRALPRSQKGVAWLALSQIGLYDRDGAWQAHLLYGYYRSSGRAGRPDLTLPVVLPDDRTVHLTLPTGQSAQSERGVHYYGLGGDWHSQGWFLDWQGWLNHGQQYEIDRLGHHQYFLSQDIHGGLLLLELGLGWGNTTIDKKKCAVPDLIRGACIQRPVGQGDWQLSLATLYSTRDHESSDGRLSGFGSLRPALGVMGGSASILLTGLAIEPNQLALANVQPQSSFQEGNQLQFSEPRTYRDNSDPAAPVYRNDGLRVGGVRLRIPIWAAVQLEQSLFLNYSAMRYGDAGEVISVWQGAGIALDPLFNGNGQPDLNWLLSLSLAWYTPFAREINPLTQQSFRARSRFYRRLQFGLVFQI
ncbi:MAG: hypothetical protein KDK39_01165 [Leptospiraceae bacterium]|nr:hypothetical protein [Leptospiraceae bacterium]